MTTRRAALGGAAGATLVWLSQPAIFVVTGVGLGLAIVAMRHRDRRQTGLLAIVLMLWAASAAAAALQAQTTVAHIDRDYFRWFWSEGFMPMPPKSASDVIWIFKKLTWAFGAFGSGIGRTNGGLNYRWSIVFTFVMLAGFWSLWRRSRDVALFLGLPIVIVAALSAAQVYPFTARLFVFLQPSLLLAVAAGAEYVLTIWPVRLQALSPVALAILGGAPIFAAASALPPFWTQHLRPIVEHIQSSRQPADRIYVSFGAGQAFHYYAGRFDIPITAVVMGRCAVGNPRDYLRQLDELRGSSRAWIVVTFDQRDGTESALMLDYLDRLGHRIDAMTVPGTSGTAMEAASGYLYNLSSAAALASTSAETYPIPRGLVSRPADPWACWGVGLPEAGRSGRF